MKKRIVLFIVALCVIILPLTTKASLIDEYEHKNLQETLEDEGITLINSNYKETEDQVIIYMFRGSGCGFCKSFLNFLNSISEEYGDKFKLVSFETWENEKNDELHELIRKTTGETDEGVPFIIIGETVFPGYISEWDESIIATINTEYEKSKTKRVDILEKAETYEEDLKKEQQAPYNRVIYWNLAFITMSTAAIITVNTMQNNKILNLLEKTNHKKTK